jgi:peptidoglycan/xylan/chitin deacetylase (PgdA/CDA1 family)
MERAWLDPIREALDLLPRPVDLFFRNDDVGWDDGRLWKLLDLFGELGLPLDLAVIPNETTAGLASRLRSRAEMSGHRIGLHQHGLTHINHEPAGRKHEFGPSRANSLQRRDLVEGRSRLRDLLGELVDPIFTPPWNRCTRTTGFCLAELGYEVLSREARAAPLDVPGLVELPIRIDWRAHRKRMPLTRAELGVLIASEIRTDVPVGLMFHHALMDEDDRAAADALLSLLAEHPMASPRRMMTLARAAAASTRAQ